MKQQIMEEFEKNFLEYSDGGVLVKYIGNDDTDIDDWLSSALDRYAMSIVEASVPESLNIKRDNEHYTEYLERVTHNGCIDATLSKAREITNQ